MYVSQGPPSFLAFLAVWNVGCYSFAPCLNPNMIEGYPGCFQVLVITSNAAMYMVEQMSSSYECASFEFMPKSGIAESCGSPIPIFLRNCHTDFQSGCTSMDLSTVFYMAASSYANTSY
ncbi:zinc finger protein [Cricetulus griseus]|nr:zinc finger protein [Cricetulus griseus]